MDRVLKKRRESSYRISQEVQTGVRGLGNQTKEDERGKPKDLRSYSPEEILGRKDFSHLDKMEEEEIKKIVITLCKKMAFNLSRRWKKGGSGDKFDFRRSIRRSIKYGGEMIELQMKEPKLKPLRLLFVCDVSGSMDIYIQFFILFMYGVQNHYPHCETFTFSTRLSHITSLLKGDFVEALRLFRQSHGLVGRNEYWEVLHELQNGHLLHPVARYFSSSVMVGIGDRIFSIRR
jgi:uncharacterized protein with von Willebrand factor type A (vWA) domain